MILGCDFEGALRYLEDCDFYFISLLDEKLSYLIYLFFNNIYLILKWNLYVTDGKMASIPELTFIGSKY